MLFAGGSTSPPARASTGISTGMGAGGRVRAQSPSLLSGVGRAVGGGRVITRAKTMMGLPGLVGAERSREGGVGESLEDEVSRKKYEKRTKVVKETWESEKVYVEGLEVIIKVSSSLLLPSRLEARADLPPFDPPLCSTSSILFSPPPRIPIPSYPRRLSTSSSKTSPRSTLSASPSSQESRRVSLFPSSHLPPS